VNAVCSLVIDDIDEDNDGIPDIIEDTNLTWVDLDSDGVDDGYDIDYTTWWVDANNDWIDDTVIPLDTDWDWTPDYLDTDSDNDNVPDLIEWHDANHDGVADTLPTGVDSDWDWLDDAFDVLHDGPDAGDNPDPGPWIAAPIQDTDGDLIVDYLDIDDDNDGIITNNEDADWDGTSANDNNDGDTFPNYLDIDADNDTIPDNIEWQTTQDYIAPSGDDTDKNWLDDAYESVPWGDEWIIPVNSGWSNDPDYIDLDSDGDTLFDIDEAWFDAHDTDDDWMTDNGVWNNGLDNDASTEIGDDYMDVNGTAFTTIFVLPDTDNDTDDDWTNASPLSFDFDWRDNCSGLDDAADCDYDGNPNWTDATWEWVYSWAVSFDATTWEIFYTALASEAWMEVTIEYEVCNIVPLIPVCDTAVVILTVWNYPVADNENVLIVTTNDPVVINYIDGDTDEDDNIDLMATTIVGWWPTWWTVEINDDGTFTYTPWSNFTWSDTFDYQLCDDTSLCDTATVTIELDTDNDGEPNITDTDDDWDGILDTVEQSTALNGWDTDQDGIPDELDTDDDGDWCETIVELEVGEDHLDSIDDCRSWSSSSVTKYTFITPTENPNPIEEHWSAEETEEVEVFPTEEDSLSLEEKDEIDIDLPEEYQDDLLDQINEMFSAETELEKLVECAWILADFREKNSCYYQDGIFNQSQWSDIEFSDDKDAIKFLTRSCYYHGPSDSQSEFKPKSNAKNWELVKIAARMWQLMPEWFNHFDASDEDWAVPYYEAANNVGLLDWLYVKDWGVYDEVSMKDVMVVYIRLLQLKWAMDASTDAMKTWSTYTSKMISREEFAWITKMFHVEVYGETDPEIPWEVEECLWLIDTERSNDACRFNDGSFDWTQWKDTEWMQYAQSIIDITNACLIHWASDSQSQYHPYVDATNAAWVKIAYYNQNDCFRDYVLTIQSDHYHYMIL